ncbi:metal-dependent hydrolase [[Mycobacterium] nativiensis]|uniref:Metal-dependent hydrolase n=1 Tax=[Mycobacterium] nativiensis TaxID=2855503 RepID=A0ABU5XTV7_9MYCO|nr:metal-dependent hydrolase [Mycolicibacter sp. MYC340]MEB3031167.1 metal-dependent hydrolase [Mycolicibacter sp. MYC340]
MRFRFEEPPSGRYFADDNMVLSHFVAELSASFPAGEESFIRSVRRVSDQITDPTLKRRAAGFIGQESTHGQEHRRLNAKLIDRGYRIAWRDSKSLRDKQLRREQKMSPRVHLAMTAGAEHYTAVLAERILSSAELQAIPGTPEVWHLLNWHALEELEHKSVAFDVYRAVGGTELTRIAVMAFLIATTVPATLLAVAVSLARDPLARRHPVRLLKEGRGLLRGPFFSGLLRDLLRYLRPGFHPDDVDTTALLELWQRKLFGDGGTLVDHLR